MTYTKKVVTKIGGYAKYLPVFALIAVLAALAVTSVCTRTPENCADGQELKPGMFCFDNKAWSKCGGNEYNPYSQGCVDGIVKERCGNNHFDPNNEFCFNNVRIYDKCNGSAFDPTRQGCDGEAVKPKCGIKPYEIETHFCFNNNLYEKCNGQEYNPAESFCDGNATYPLCGGRDYDPSTQTCNGTSVVEIAKCNGLAYDNATYFCHNNSLYPKCGGREYNPSTQSCSGTAVVNRPPETPRPKYTVYFNANGGTEGANPPSAVTVDSGTIITLPGKQTMSKDGFSFGGWNADGTDYGAGDPYTVVGETTLDVRWIPVRTITFNANGATGGDAPDAVRADSGKIITLPGRGTMVRTGFSFGWWNTNSNGTGASFRGDSAYTVTGNITLYAKWVPVYTVTYSGNGTTAGVPGEVKADSGSVITLPKAITRDGYSFGWWSTSSYGTGTKYNPDEFYMVTGNTYIYVKWIPIYTVTFNNNGATSGTAPDTMKVDSGTVITLPGQGNIAKTNNHFGGWSTTSFGGTNYPAGSSYTVTGNVTLFARWTAYPIYTVTYNGNGATSGSVAAMSVDSGSVITIPDKGTLVRIGYSFGGWNTNNTNTGTNYSVGTSYTVTSNVILYVRWIPIYTVTFNGNGATSGNVSAMPVDSGSVITIPDKGTLVRIGYSFGGWNTNNTNTGTNYSVGGTYTVTKNDTLYAKWVIETYTLTTNVTPFGSGTVSRNPSANSYDFGTYVTVTAIPASGYKFTTWSYGGDAYGDSHDTSTVISINENTALTAIFHSGFTFTDSRDGKTYGAVKIGNQTWMSDNLNYQTADSWCYNNDGSNCYSNGRLYTWTAAQTACPNGWHLPTRGEWETLTITAGNGYDGEGAAVKLKRQYAYDGWVAGTDDFGFSARPGGVRELDGRFHDWVNGTFQIGIWWTATSYNGSRAYNRMIAIFYLTGNGVSESDNDKGLGCSVRCVKND